jgi:histidinol phosphatase-like PHP family hydrolase
MGARMGVRFCIGDDSHRPAQVGFGLEQARLHLLRNGVREVHFLTRENGQIVPASARLDAD